MELGETFEGYTEIISGISARQLIFLGSDRETVPGDRVLLAADMAQKTGLSGAVLQCDGKRKISFLQPLPRDLRKGQLLDILREQRQQKHAEDIPGGNSPSGEADGPAGGVSGRENIFPVFAEVREMGREYTLRTFLPAPRSLLPADTRPMSPIP